MVVRDPSLIRTQFCALLKTVLFRRAYEILYPKVENLPTPRGII